MRTKSNYRFKTLGPQAARLVTALHERGRRIFTLAEVADITGLKEASARSFARKLVDRDVRPMSPGVTTARDEDGIAAQEFTDF